MNDKSSLQIELARRIEAYRTAVKTDNLARINREAQRLADFVSGFSGCITIEYKDKNDETQDEL